jgi:hypothetical protein
MAIYEAFDEPRTSDTVYMLSGARNPLHRFVLLSLLLLLG